MRLKLPGPDAIDQDSARAPPRSATLPARSGPCRFLSAIEFTRHPLRQAARYRSHRQSRQFDGSLGGAMDQRDGRDRRGRRASTASPWCKPARPPSAVCGRPVPPTRTTICPSVSIRRQHSRACRLLRSADWAIRSRRCFEQLDGPFLHTASAAQLIEAAAILQRIAAGHFVGLPLAFR